MTAAALSRVTPAETSRLCRPPVDDETLTAAGRIVGEVRSKGEAAVRRFATEFGERSADEPLLLDRHAMEQALASLGAADRQALERAAARIRDFAQAQRDSIVDVDIPVPGGRAGHTVEPIEAAGCYAPAGRYPLPSSVLMTAITARVAGCARVVVASPGADPVTLAAAAIAGADAFLAVGGAHAIAALAYGFEGFERCDVIVGPGNRWVTAAKQLVTGVVRIDMLAGPSELLVLADDTADAGTVAADLLAQAEHDADAVPMLVTTSAALADAVDVELERQLAQLPTRDVAAAAMGNGFVCVASSLDEAIDITNRMAPEHLEIMTADADGTAARIRHAGALFVGEGTAEVVGDYGAGPNHTLPTGGTARFQAGLSIFDFLRMRTWIRMDDRDTAAGVLDDTARIARMEGLIGHERSALRRVASTQTADGR